MRLKMQGVMSSMKKNRAVEAAQPEIEQYRKALRLGGYVSGLAIRLTASRTDLRKAAGRRPRA